MTKTSIKTLDNFVPPKKSNSVPPKPKPRDIPRDAMKRVSAKLPA